MNLTSILNQVSPKWDWAVEDVDFLRQYSRDTPAVQRVKDHARLLLVQRQLEKDEGGRVLSDKEKMLIKGACSAHIFSTRPTHFLKKGAINDVMVCSQSSLILSEIHINTRVF